MKTDHQIPTRDLRVAAIIITYNATNLIRRSIQSLMANSYPVDIWIFDCNSQDDTVEIIEKEFPNVILNRSPENLGFGKANNIGMNWALQQGYDYMLLINQDAGLHPEAIAQMVETSTVFQDTKVISPTHLNGAKTELDFGFAHYLNSTVSIEHYEEKYKEKNFVDVPFVNAAIWFIPAVILKKVGLFSPLFFHYGEDVNWCKRLAYWGYSLAVLPQTWGYHDRHRKLVDIKRKFFFRKLDWMNRLADPRSNLLIKTAWVVLADVKELISSFHAEEWKGNLRIVSELINSLPRIARERKKFKKEGYCITTS